MNTVAMNRSVPTSTLLPHVVYRDLPEASTWLCRVFGFVEDYRYGEPVSGIQIHLGDASLQLTGPREGTGSPAVLGGCTQMLTVMVDDVDAHFEAAKKAGATI